jgi:methylated-DNA-[protein]-cysteine S-methyltransferase
MRAVLDSPVGPITLVEDGGALTGLYMEAREPAGRGGVLDAAAEQLDAYFAGQLTEFDLPIELRGTPFQREVWAALLAIPFGRTTSYRQLAMRVGRPAAYRAVGMANGRNPISIVVPCHRVIGSDGSLTGYGGGIERKSWLLAHEGVQLASGA